MGTAGILLAATSAREFVHPKNGSCPLALALRRVSLSTKKYSTDTWSLELRPIIDKQIGRWHVAFNPTLERALKGPGTKSGFEFSPNVKVSYDFTTKISGGIEYYGAVGPVTGFNRLSEQKHQFIPAIGLNISPKWEFNFGVGVTRSTDHLLVKMIVGRRFEFKRKH